MELRVLAGSKVADSVPTHNLQEAQDSLHSVHNYWALLLRSVVRAAHRWFWQTSIRAPDSCWPPASIVPKFLSAVQFP